MWIVSLHSVTHGGIKFSVSLSLNGELNTGVYAINEVKILNYLAVWSSSPKHCLKRLCISRYVGKPMAITFASRTGF
jgi:hypothetical protein